MRISLVFMLFLCALSCIAQKKNDVQVEYQLFYDTDMPVTLYAVLQGRNNVSIYEEIFNTRKNWKQPKEVDYVDMTAKADDASQYFKIDSNKKEILFTDFLGHKKVLIKDEYVELKWQITDETKDIAGYTCSRAVTTFRGREWVAWFAPQIPLPYGPWKLNGLPGLILEASDAANSYTFKATKVEFNNNTFFDKDFAKIAKVNNKTPISYRKFLEDDMEANENRNKQLQANAPEGVTFGTITIEPRKGMELKFEWEP